MQFIIDRNKLTEAVSDVLKAVSAKTTIPILTGIKIIATNDGIRLIGSDSNISIERFIPIEEDDMTYIELKKTGSIVLQARYFSEIVRKLPSEQVELTVADRFVTKITSASSEFNLNGLDPEEYPRLMQMEERHSFQIQTDLLKNVIRQTAFAVSTSETRPILTGVNWKYENRKLTCTATDSHRLAMKHIPVQDELGEIPFSNVVIPGKSLTELAKIIDEKNELIDIVMTDHHILFKAKHILFYSRLLDGSYPDTKRLIPTESKTKIILSTKQFLQAIERASVLAREEQNNVVKLISLDRNKLEIFSNSAEIGQVFEQIETESYDGEELKISFSAKYMLDALKAIDSSTIMIDFTGAMRPFLIRPTDDDSQLQLILPVRTY